MFPLSLSGRLVQRCRWFPLQVGLLYHVSNWDHHTIWWTRESCSCKQEKDLVQEAETVASLTWFLLHVYWIFAIGSPTRLTQGPHGHFAQWFSRSCISSVEPSWSWFDQRDVRFYLTWRKKTRNCKGNHNTFSELAVWHHIEQCQKLCPAFSCEGPFCQYVCQLLGCVDVIDLNRWVQVDAVIEPVQIHSLSPWHVSHRRASSCV